MAGRMKPMCIDTEQIRNLMDKAVADKEVAGVSCKVMKDGRELFFLTSGFADIEQRIPMERDTILRLYSMSKPLTGAAVMLLFEKGMIDLGEPVEKYLPGFASQVCLKDDSTIAPVQRPMIIHDLLSMTSGLPYGGESPAGKAAESVFAEALERMFTGREMTTVEIADRFGQLPLEFSPGSHFLYGTSADVLGAVIEVITGTDLGTFMKNELFDPLDMRDTGFFMPESKRQRMAMAYTRINGRLIPFTGNHLAVSRDYTTPPGFKSGGAGLLSTLEDYSHFASMLLNKGCYNGKRILNEETVRFFTKAGLQKWQFEDLQRGWPGLSGYSYGNLMRVMTDPALALMQVTPFEYGWDGWLGPYFSNHPAEQLTFLVGMQLTDAGTTPLTRKLRNLVLTGLRQPSEPETPVCL